MTTELTQQEADDLLAMEKHKTRPEGYAYPAVGGKLSIPLVSSDEREKFFLDVSRRKIELSRNKFQTRARIAMVLARLDLCDTPHRNPDGEEIPGPHIHFYKEGYGDAWAQPLPAYFTNPEDCNTTLKQFMQYCAVTDAPEIFQGLWKC